MNGRLNRLIWPGYGIDCTHTGLTLHQAIVEMLDSVKNEVNEGSLFHGAGSWINKYYTHIIGAKSQSGTTIYGILLGGGYLYYFVWNIGNSDLTILKELG